MNSDSILQNPSDVFLVKLNANDGKRSNTRIIPTNLIQQTSASGLFKINTQNDFFIAGFLYNEAEFGNKKLSMQCNGNFIPLQHYVARAKEGWQQDRKNLGSKEQNELLGIQLYPNPTLGEVRIETPKRYTIQHIEIIDPLGNTQVADYNLVNGTINLEDLNNGIYLIRIFVQNQFQTIKIIKQ